MATVSRSDGPVRVLLTTPNLGTAGSKGLVARLAMGADSRRFQVTVGVGERCDSHLERSVSEHVAIEELPLRSAHRPLMELWRSAGRLAERLRGRFDLVHSFDYSDAYGEALGVRRAALPWIAEKTNLIWRGRAWWLRFGLARTILCHSRAALEVVPKVLRGRCESIPIGVDLDAFAQSPDLERLRSAGVPIDGPRLVCVADLVPVKGHLPLLEAFAAVLVEHSAARLVLIGDGDPQLRRELLERMERDDLRGRVHWLGRREDVASLLSAFDGFVLATRNVGRREAFGQVVVEAMASGLPVVATRSGGPEELVVDGETGWLVSAEGAAPLADGMVALLSSLEGARSMGRAGRRRAEENYGLARMVRRYEAVWQRLAGAP